MLAGGLVGVINGLFITRLKVIPFIATLGTLGMARGVAKWIAGPADGERAATRG